MSLDNIKPTFRNLSPEDTKSLEWVYETTRSGIAATLLWGMAMQISGENPDWKFWQVVTEVRRRFSDDKID